MRLTRTVPMLAAAFIAGATCTAVVRPPATPPATPPAAAVVATAAPPAVTSTPARLTTPTAVPSPTAAGLRDGTFVVGAQMAPGTYRAPGGDRCYWARLSGFGGAISEIIANENARGPVVVTIAPTDKGFLARGCGAWTPMP